MITVATLIPFTSKRVAECVSVRCLCICQRNDGLMLPAKTFGIAFRQFETNAREVYLAKQLAECGGKQPDFIVTQPELLLLRVLDQARLIGRKRHSLFVFAG